ncbi:hypothetical protein MVES1_003458 [Malassezia vespertilionis]|uniref:Chalcone isomerase domain-containing protein n=1 Tax=Malassezia vespertilionis TaxID=2020962 RepID=A0A2N1J7G1_9BASI|nr:uncharacterized protein MVES1_003458 [Malassezia vespertilionis]PKI82481.1 hypothetical protein MVES_003697 [Malassezia vespertilionis]WFD08089.1 hypothetical protein MVES1_003458 [Malassezia vespertilionis]
MSCLQPSVLRGVRAARRVPHCIVRHASSAPPRVRPRPWACAALALAAAAAAAGVGALHLEAPHASVPVPVDRVVFEQATKIGLPLHMDTPGGDVNIDRATLRLAGLGVRTVTFLGLRVYVVGMYVAEDALEATQRAVATTGATPNLEETVSAWLHAGIPCAVRLVPVRNTDFQHMRDGLVRAVNVRAKDARQGKNVQTLLPAADAALARNIQQFKALFPRGKMPERHALDVIVQRSPVTSQYCLAMQYDGKPLGTLASEPTMDAAAPGELVFTLPMNLLLAYAGERPDISAALRASMVHSLVHGLL